MSAKSQKVEQCKNIRWNLLLVLAQSHTNQLDLFSFHWCCCTKIKLKIQTVCCNRCNHNHVNVVNEALLLNFFPNMPIHCFHGVETIDRYHCVLVYLKNNRKQKTKNRTQNTEHESVPAKRFLSRQYLPRACALPGHNIDGRNFDSIMPNVRNV